MPTVLLMLLSLGAGPQKAPPPQIEWVPTLDQAVEIARERNAVILLAFSVDGHRKAKIQRQGTFKNPLFIKRAREELICVIAHRGATRGEEHTPVEIRDPRTGAIGYKCPLYEGVTCEQHRSIYGQLTSRYRFKEPPATFLLSPEGDIILGTEGFPPQSFHALKKVDEAQSKLEGPTLGATAYRKVLRSFDKAEGKLVEARYLYAISGFQKILGKKRMTAALRLRAQEALNDINQIGLRLIEKGKKRHQEDPVEGIKQLKKVRKEFKGLEAEEQARALILELEGAEK